MVKVLCFSLIDWIRSRYEVSRCERLCESNLEEIDKLYMRAWGLNYLTEWWDLLILLNGVSARFKTMRLSNETTVKDVQYIKLARYVSGTRMWFSIRIRSKVYKAMHMWISVWMQMWPQSMWLWYSWSMCYAIRMYSIKL